VIKLCLEVIVSSVSGVPSVAGVCFSVVSVSNVWDLSKMIEVTFIVVVSSIPRVPGMKFVSRAIISFTNIRK
jgi:hypothetical protein